MVLQILHALLILEDPGLKFVVLVTISNISNILVDGKCHLALSPPSQKLTLVWEIITRSGIILSNSQALLYIKVTKDVELINPGFSPAGKESRSIEYSRCWRTKVRWFEFESCG
jgi:hypothetical protein